MNDGAQTGGGSIDPVERMRADAKLLEDFMTCVQQSEQMLLQGGVDAQRARDIAFARSLLLLPSWCVVACAVKGEGPRPDIKQLSMVSVRDAQGNTSASLAVFPTASLADAEAPRMKMPIEGGFWVTVAVPTEQAPAWVRGMGIPSVSVVAAAGANGPTSVLGLDFVDWVAKVEAQQRAAAEPGAASNP